MAAARGLSQDAVRKLIAQHTKGRTLGLWGEPRINVLELNLALDQIAKYLAATPDSADSDPANRSSFPGSESRFWNLQVLDPKPGHPYCPSAAFAFHTSILSLAACASAASGTSSR